MSHELRTPLNSLLILSKMLAENRDGNLTAEQVKFAQTVYTSGNDLLALINEILDLSKVEAGKMPIDPHDVRARATCASTSSRPSGTWPSRRGSTSRSGWTTDLPATIFTRRQSPAADPQEPALERLQVHGQGRRRP